MYVKNKQNIDVDNVVLRPWQEGLLKYIKPSERVEEWVQSVARRRMGSSS